MKCARTSLVKLIKYRGRFKNFVCEKCKLKYCTLSYCIAMLHVKSLLNSEIELFYFFQDGVSADEVENYSIKGNRRVSYLMATATSPTVTLPHKLSDISNTEADDEDSDNLSVSYSFSLYFIVLYWSLLGNCCKHQPKRNDVPIYSESWVPNKIDV